MLHLHIFLVSFQSRFYSTLNLPLQERVIELSRIIDLASPHKDLQVLFLQLINNIFSTSPNNSWNLRHITYESNLYEFEALMSFLEPQGPMFRLCYKLLADPQLKFNLPLNTLPVSYCCLKITLNVFYICLTWYNHLFYTYPLFNHLVFWLIFACSFSCMINYDVCVFLCSQIQ